MSRVSVFKRSSRGWKMKSRCGTQYNNIKRVFRQSNVCCSWNLRSVKALAYAFIETKERKRRSDTPTIAVAIHCQSEKTKNNIIRWGLYDGYCISKNSNEYKTKVLDYRSRNEKKTTKQTHTQTEHNNYSGSNLIIIICKTKMVE